MPSPLTDSASEPLIDRPLLERLERLSLLWRQSFNGRVGGRTPSLFAGPGHEFLDHRNFHPGDDMRNVNWRAFLRFEKIVLKTFQIEPRVPVRLLLDVSASMITGSRARGAEKFSYARKLAAALVYIGLVRLDSIEVQPFTDKLEEPFFCTGGRHQFQPVELYLRKLRSGGRTDLKQVVRQFLGRYPQRGLVVIVSDFLQDEDCLRPLQFLSDFGHELLLLQVWSPDDRSPAQSGEIELIDAETGFHQAITVDDEACRAYTAAFDAYAAQLNRLADRTGGRYLGLSTDTPLEQVLFGPLRLSATM